MDPLSGLTTFAQSFGIAAPAAPPATAPTFLLTLAPPPAGVPDVAALIASTLPPVPRTEIRDGAVSLDWLTKDVRFVTTSITDAAMVGGLPVSDFIQPTGISVPNIAAATTGPTSPPGVPGLLGHLGGTVPIAVQVIEPPTSERTISVSASVRWRIRDENGGLVSVTWQRLGDAATSSGSEIIQSLGNLPSATPPTFATNLLTLTFPLLFTELLGTAPPLPRRRIEAALRLEVAAAGIATDWIDLPPIDIFLPAIPVPRIAIFTADVDFGGQALIVVPSGSPLTNVSDVTTAISSLAGTLTPLAGAMPGLNVFLTQFGLVLGALSSSRPLFQVADSIPFLRDQVWTEGLGNVIFNFNAEDTISAMAVVGPPGRVVQCFNDREFSDSQGQLNVSTGTGVMTTIRDLGSSAPPCDPAGNISIPRPPGGARFFLHGISTFGDEFSSMRFV